MDSGSKDFSKSIPLFFLHGFPTTSALWSSVISELENDFPCVALDIPGFGDTTIPLDMERDIESNSEAIHRFASALSLETAHIVAHGSGCANALALALQRPGFVKSLFLINPQFGDNLPGLFMRSIKIIAKNNFSWNLAFKTKSIYFLLEKGLRKTMVRNELSDQIMQEFLRPLKNSPSARLRFQKFLNDFNPRLTSTLTGHLKKIKIPVTIVSGENDKISTSEWGSNFSKKFTNARHHIIENTGNVLPLESPLQLSDIILQSMDSVF